MRSASAFEPLECRRLASTSLNANLVVNGNAEAGPAASDVATPVNIPGWTTDGQFTVIPYGTVGFLVNSDVPAEHGRNFFSGGRIGLPDPLNKMPTATQLINVSDIARDIDQGLIKYDFSAGLGGYGTEDDTMNVSIAFADANKKLLNSVELNGPSAAARQNKSGLLNATARGDLPQGTRFIGIRLAAVHKRGYVADGYADNISLKLSSTETDATITGTVFNDANANGKQDTGEKGMAGVPVVASGSNPNRLLVSDTTDANGRYTLTGVTPGTVRIGVPSQPEGFRKTRPIAQTFNAVAGLTTEAPQAFAFTQRSLISGSVVRDPNSPSVFDDNDNGLAGMTVWLDTNNNGRLDKGEKSALTDEDGNYRFVVSRGTYNVRVKSNTEYRQVTPGKSKPIRIKLASGATSIGNVFSMEPLPQ